jgi:hypothetical protein
LALLLASALLLLASALLLAFLALLLAPAGKASHESLRLIRNPSNGVLRSLHSLSCLVGHLACGVLRSSALLLLGPATTLGLRGTGLLDGLLGLGGRGNLQVEEAPVGTELQTDKGSGLILNGARRLSLFVGGPLGALRTRKIRDVAHYLLGDRVALLIDGLLDDVALFVDGALYGLPFFVGGGLTEQLGAGGEVLGDLACLVDGLPGGLLDLAGGLSCGVLDPLGGLPDLIGDALNGSALSLLSLLPLLLALAHFFSYLTGLYFPVDVLLPDTSVLGMKEELGLVPAGYIPSLLGCLGLGLMERGRPLVAFTDYGPSILSRLYMHRGFVRHEHSPT